MCNSCSVYGGSEGCMNAPLSKFDSSLSQLTGSPQVSQRACTASPLCIDLSLELKGASLS